MPRVVHVVDVAAVDVPGRAEHLPGDPGDAAAGKLSDREHVEAGVQRRLGRHPDPPAPVSTCTGRSARPSPTATGAGRRRRSRTSRSGRTARVAHQQLPRDRAERGAIELRLGLGELRSSRCIAAASTPAPQLTAKYRPSATPSDSLNASSSSALAIRTPVASTGSSGSPSARTRMFVAPPGSTPSAVSVPASALTASLIVPSPEKTTTRSTPSSTACAASSRHVRAPWSRPPRAGSRPRAPSRSRPSTGWRSCGRRGSRREGRRWKRRHRQAVSQGRSRSPVAPTGDRRQQGDLLGPRQSRVAGRLARRRRPPSPRGDRGEAVAVAVGERLHDLGHRGSLGLDLGGSRDLAERREQPNGHAWLARKATRRGALRFVHSRSRGSVVLLTDRHPRRCLPAARGAAARPEDRAAVGRVAGRTCSALGPRRCWWMPPRTRSGAAVLRRSGSRDAASRCSP